MTRPEMHATLAVLRTAITRKWLLTELPRQQQADVERLATEVRRMMDADPHVGPLLEGAIDRLEKAIAVQTTAPLIPYDLTTLARFLDATAVPR